LVFFDHWNSSLLHEIRWVARVSAQGDAGVSFFFILSGFVLMWSHQPGTTKRVFYGRRFARVYPAYFVMCLVALPLVVWFGDIKAPVHVVEAVIPFSLLQAWIPHYRVAFGGNGVSWSLSCEAFFYAIFPFVVAPVIGLTRRGKYLLLAACAVAPWVFAAVTRPEVAESWRYLVLYTNPVARSFEFVIGMTLASLFRQGLRLPWLRPGPAYLLAAVVYFAAGWTPLAVQHIPLSIVPLSLAIFASAQADVEGRTPRLLAAPAMITLGQWSYAFYLVHQLVLRSFRQTFERPKHPTHTLAVVYGLPAYLISIGLAALLYTYVEHPWERRLRPGRVRASSDAALA
jgi:peptidoglycan/LPS O-acetylase OafA/YrhL